MKHIFVSVIGVGWEMGLTKQYNICYYTGYDLKVTLVSAETAREAKEDFKKWHGGFTFVAIREHIRAAKEYAESGLNE